MWAVPFFVSQEAMSATGVYSLNPGNIVNVGFEDSVSRSVSGTANNGTETYTGSISAGTNRFGDLKASASASGQVARAFSPFGEGEVLISYSDTYQELFTPTLEQRFPQSRIFKFTLDYSLTAQGPFFDRGSRATVAAVVTDPFGQNRFPDSPLYRGVVQDNVAVQSGFGDSDSISKNKEIPFVVHSFPNNSRAPADPGFNPTPYLVDYRIQVSLRATAFTAAGNASSAVSDTLFFDSITLEDGVTTPESLGIFGTFTSGNLSPNLRVPEPSTLVAISLGLLGLMTHRHRNSSV